MPTLPTELRNKLERTCIAARNEAERAASAALESLAVQHHEAYAHMGREEKDLRNKLRARARQLGDTQDSRGQLSVKHLGQECAYEHWHRMLFARFLAENNLLIEPEMGVAISLEECKELAKEEKTDLWTLAGRYAQKMLPEIFRADDPVLQVPLAREDELKLEELLDGLPTGVFTASDSLGWCYQFWQAERKAQVNEAGNKIGPDELPSVTQLFTEDYMVDFLLDNTLGAWHAGKVLAANPRLATSAKNEEELRKAVALPGCPWKHLRFIKGKDGKWTPATGMFDGWPRTAKKLKCIDPSMGSGHFVVGMFERLVALRMAEEKLDQKAAIAKVIRDNLFGLEIDPRCTQIGAFNLALAAWRRVGHCALPAMNLACSGLAPNTPEADWLKIAGDSQKLQRGMERLYRLFQKAAVLGSMINPQAGEGDLLVAAFHELQPLLERALTQEAEDDTAHEMAVTAHGLAKAAEILASQFTLIATNVPYLMRGKQGDDLRDFIDAKYPHCKPDLAVAFLERCREFTIRGGTYATVTPQNWLFLGSYRALRKLLLTDQHWNHVSKLGSGAAATESWEVLRALSIISNTLVLPGGVMSGLDAPFPTDNEKAAQLNSGEMVVLEQMNQLKNPDCRIVLSKNYITTTLLSAYARAFQGMATGDYSRFGRCFWEVGCFGEDWVAQQSTFAQISHYGGREHILYWQAGTGDLAASTQARIQGLEALSRMGVVVSQMRNLPVGIFTGDHFDNNVSALVVSDRDHLAAVWAFCSSPTYNEKVREIDQKMSVTNATLTKVPFDLMHWQKSAAAKYPHGLPKPFSSDPTQWLFNGQPKGADHPLHVGVARLIGYQWPRQTGSDFSDCPALGPDGLEKLADDDGIVCIPSVRGEDPAAERLRKLLAVAFGKDWRAQTELELIRASGSEAADLEEWLRNDFFAQHCALFHQRPFIWHIWDGRKQDGFHVLVNYHKLAGEKGKGRRALENLTHSYLNDWISRQKDGEKRGDEGAEERLAAALELKRVFEAVIEGEGDPARGTGFDILPRQQNLWLESGSGSFPKL